MKELTKSKDSKGVQILALDFCRECLGWSSASPNGHSIVENRRRPESPHLWTKTHGFHLDPRDVSHLINAVGQWSDLHGCCLCIAYSPGQEENRWSVRIAPHAEVHGGGLNESLLRACMGAGRAIQSTGQVHPAETPLTKNNPPCLPSRGERSASMGRSRWLSARNALGGEPRAC